LSSKLKPLFHKILRDLSASLYKIKVDGTELYRTTQESQVEAEKVARVLDNIAKTFAVDSNMNLQFSNVRECRGDYEGKKKRLTNMLKDISMKTTLRIRRKYLIFPRVCKYLKP